MTPEQKLKWAVLQRTDHAVPYPCEDIDERYAKIVEEDLHWDARAEVRGGDVETGLQCDWSRHYESKSVAMSFPDGSWVGWTYWFGGGKHGEPEAIDWIPDAYDLDCKEEEKLVVVRTFAKK
jgi:hypothetical protein